MPTNRTQQTSFADSAYDPGSLATYRSGLTQANNLLGTAGTGPGGTGGTGAAGVLSQYMANPFQSALVNQRQAMTNQGIFAQNANQMANMANRASMWNYTPEFLASQQAAQERGVSGQISNSYMNNLLNAQQLQQGAMQSALNYKPLAPLTGTNISDSTSGLGTWLPQVAAAGLGALAGYFNRPGARTTSTASGSSTPQTSGTNFLGGPTMLDPMFQQGNSGGVNLLQPIQPYGSNLIGTGTPSNPSTNINTTPGNQVINNSPTNSINMGGGTTAASSPNLLSSLFGGTGLGSLGALGLNFLSPSLFTGAGLTGSEAALASGVLNPLLYAIMNQPAGGGGSASDIANQFNPNININVGGSTATGGTGYGGAGGNATAIANAGGSSATGTPGTSGGTGGTPPFIGGTGTTGGQPPNFGTWSDPMGNPTPQGIASSQISYGQVGSDQLAALQNQLAASGFNLQQGSDGSYQIVPSGPTSYIPSPLPNELAPGGQGYFPTGTTLVNTPGGPLYYDPGSQTYWDGAGNPLSLSGGPGSYQQALQAYSPTALGAIGGNGANTQWRYNPTTGAWDNGGVVYSGGNFQLAGPNNSMTPLQWDPQHHIYWGKGGPFDPTQNMKPLSSADLQLILLGQSMPMGTSGPPATMNWPVDEQGNPTGAPPPGEIPAGPIPGSTEVPGGGGLLIRPQANTVSNAAMSTGINPMLSTMQAQSQVAKPTIPTNPYAGMFSTPGGMMNPFQAQQFATQSPGAGVTWKSVMSNSANGPIEVMIPVDQYGNNLSGIYGNISPSGY